MPKLSLLRKAKIWWGLFWDRRYLGCRIGQGTPMHNGKKAQGRRLQALDGGIFA